VTSSISVALFERMTGVTLAEAVVVELEQQTRALEQDRSRWNRNRDPSRT